MCCISNVTQSLYNLVHKVFSSFVFHFVFGNFKILRMYICNITILHITAVYKLLILFRFCGRPTIPSYCVQGQY